MSMIGELLILSGIIAGASGFIFSFQHGPAGAAGPENFYPETMKAGIIFFFTFGILGVILILAGAP